MRLQTLIENFPSAILVEDSSRHIVEANVAFCSLFQIPVSPRELRGLDCAAAAEQTKLLFVDPDKFIERIDEILRNRRSEFNEVLELADGRFFERDYIPVQLDGQREGQMWLYRDITDRKVAERKILGKIHTDSLTNIANREFFYQTLESYLAEKRSDFNIMFLDLDNFKWINDHHTHAAGDLTLTETARRIQSLLRAGDIAARMGGDEFAVIVQGGADRASLMLLAQRLLAAVQKPLDYQGQSLNVGVSIGIVVVSEFSGMIAKELVNAADKAMYEVKRSGRNGIAFAEKTAAP